MAKRRVVMVRYTAGVLRVKYPSPWTVVERGTKRVIDVAKTKADAIEIGSWAARQLWALAGKPAQLVVYTKRGTICFERTYGHDPRRRKG